MKNLLESLVYIHSWNIIHRDLKPENLILRNKQDDFDVVIVDFGLSTMVKDDQLPSLACGSPGYIAPEVLEGNSYDYKADVFSFGVICYLLLTGKKLFHAMN